MKPIKLEITKGLYLNAYFTDKFKTNLISINLNNPLKRENITSTALIPDVLTRGSINHPTMLEVTRKKESLYATKSFVNVNNKGENRVLYGVTKWVSSKYIEKDINKEVIELLIEVLFSPLLENGSFKELYVEQEKENLRSKIRAQKDEKRSYAIYTAIERLFENQPFGLNTNGYEEDLKKITAQKLYKDYKEFISSAQIEIFYIGHEVDLDINSLAELGKISKIASTKILPPDIFKKNMDIERIEESQQVQQSKLVQIYSTKIDNLSPKQPALKLATEILGGGPTSKLFNVLREQYSLVYYISSSLIRSKSIIIIDAGIESDKYDLANNLIDKCIEDIKLGNITEEELSLAKKSLINNIKASLDSQISLASALEIDNYYGIELSIEEKIKEIEHLTLEDVVEASKYIELELEYFLKGVKPIANY